MKIIFVSILTVATIGLLIPSASADIFIHKLDPQFSIQHPNGWIIQEFPEYRGIAIDADLTGRNGMWIGLDCSTSMGEDWGFSGTPPVDYQELEWIKEYIIDACESASYSESYLICYNQKIIDKYVHYVDGYKAYSFLIEETWHQDGKDPNFPDGGGAHKILAIDTTLYVNNDIWTIFIANDFDNFSMEQTEKILSTFKVNDIYDQEDIFTPPTWYEQLINAIMSLFAGGNDESPAANSVIRESIEEEYVPEKDYQLDNPIIIDDLEY